MSEQPRGTFWFGNAILGGALVLLLFMGRAWELMGAGAMFVWLGLAALGTYLIMRSDVRS